MDFVNGFFSGLEPTTLLIIGAVWGIVIVPGLFFGLLKLHTIRVVNRKNALMRKNDTPLVPKWRKMQPKLSFTMKDKRAIFQKKIENVDADDEPKRPFFTRKILFLLLIIGSFVIAPALMFLEFYLYAFIAPFILFYGAIFYGLNSPVKIMSQHEELYSKMYKIISSQLGVEEELRGNLHAIITVKKWAADMITPLQIDIKIPATFNASGELGFLEQFNQVYGNTRAWVARSEEKGVPGWDYENGVLHLFAVPPIPMIAPWHERYVLTPGIAWSFFPVGLGAENGVELMNPDTGKNEYVLGFDVSGEQGGEGKKHGLKVGNEIVTSPMVLVGGTTGSGKAIDNETPVLILNKAPTPHNSPGKGSTWPANGLKTR